MVEYCGWCHGQGQVQSSQAEPCNRCSGSGRIPNGNNFSDMIYCNVCGGSGDSNTLKEKTCGYCGGNGIDQHATRQKADEARAENEKRKDALRKKQTGKAATQKTKSDGTKPLTKQDVGVGLVTGLGAFAFLAGPQAFDPMGAGLIGAVAGAVAARIWKIVLVLAACAAAAYIYFQSNAGSPV